MFDIELKYGHQTNLEKAKTKPAFCTLNHLNIF